MSLDVRWVVTGPFQENSYVLTCSETREALLVDPGDDAGDIAALVAEAGAKPVAIVATHGHIDHIGAIAEMHEKYGIPCFAPPGDQEWIEALPMQAQMFRLGPKRAPTIDRALVDGLEIAFGNVRGVAVHTPGHTLGGTCLWFAGEKVLMTGDTLFVGSIGRTDLPGGHFPTLAKSIRERLFTLPDDVTFYAGHGEPGNLGEERRNNPFVGDAALAQLGVRGKRMP